MKRLVLFLTLFATSAFATDRQLLNPDNNSDLYLRVNVAGTVTDALKVVGTTGALVPSGGFGTTTSGAASASTSGLVTTGTQTLAGQKNFQDGVTVGGGGLLDAVTFGTFTPTLHGSSTQPTVTYTVQSGYEFKLGPIAFITFVMTWSAASGGTGNASVTGMPSSPSSSPSFSSPTHCKVINMTADTWADAGGSIGLVFRSSGGPGSSGSAYAITDGSFEQFTSPYGAGVKSIQCTGVWVL